MCQYRSGVGAEGQSVRLTFCEAEFRGPGAHHRFDASDEDEYMDMDQRTRLLGGSGGRVILLGDGTEIITGSADDDDVDMGEAEEVEDSDIEEQIKKGQAESTKTNINGEQDRVQREGAPGLKTQEPTKDSSSTATPDEPKTKAATDGPATE
jgi:protein phosphatase 2C family protein 2/3